MILIKVIPDKIFHILWSYASKCKDLNEYILHFTSIKSKGYIDFYRECNINESDIIETLTNIYKAASLSFKEIVDLSGKKKVEISNIFCIPIRTIEDWYSGKSRCNDYIRLMLIRHFSILYLGKHVENEYINFEKKKKSRYKSTKNEDKNIKIYNEKSEIINRKDLQSEIQSSEEFLIRLKKSEETAKILSDTEYLNDIIKKNTFNI